MTIRAVLIFVLCLFSAHAGAKEKGDGAPKSKKADPAADFFQTTGLHTVHIRITYEQFQMMQPSRRARPAPLDASTIPAPNAAAPEIKPAAPAGPKAIPDEGQAPNVANYGYEYPYVKAHVEIDDVAMTDVGVRYKGNSSYDGAARGLKRPMKLDFNRFVPGRHFHGIEALNLGNNAYDPSLLRESISYHVYRAAGVAAPRTTLATVYLSVEGQCDREYIGCYTIVEEVDGDSFLKRHFGAAELPVFKPESIRGLPYMGEDIRNWAERYRPKTRPDPVAARPLVEFVKLLNYADDATFLAKVEDVFDVDSFLQYLAVTGLICDLDSILANYHNFYLVVAPADAKAGKPSRVHFLPWDMNLSLASYGGGSDQLVNLNIRKFWGGTNKLIDRFLAIDKYRDAYLAHVRRITNDVLLPSKIEPLFEALEANLLEADEAATASIAQTRMGPIGLEMERSRGWHGSSGRGRANPREFLARRAESVLAQLDNKLDADNLYTPSAYNPGAQRMGVRASYSYGGLSLMAQAIRKLADKDGDFAVSPREARDAAAALYYQIADEDHPESIDAKRLAAGLDPIVTAFGARPMQAGRDEAPSRWTGRKAAPSTSSAGQAWATAILAFADSNGDGKLTLAELLSATDRLACLSDPDYTDRLGERELTEALDELVSPEK